MNQGDLFWITFDPPSGSGPGYRHPHVIVQNNVFNQSRIGTVVVCALTSILDRGKAPGNVLLSKGEGSLPKASVVNVSQLFTVDKGDLEQKIGTLSAQRVEQILQGIDLLLKPREVRS